MGNIEAKNRLFRSISDNDSESFRGIIARYPHLLNEPISDDKKTTALTRAAYINRPQVISCLIELGADLDKTGVNCVSALMWAAARGNLDCLNLLLDYGADPELFDMDGLTVSDYAILYGQYEIAWALQKRDLICQKTVEELEAIREKKETLWIDFQGMKIALQGQLPPDVAPEFTVPPRKERIVLDDPVPDPNETWKNWFNRVLEFEHPPLVERNSLPVNLQPQNTLKGKIKIFMGIENSPRGGVEQENVIELDADNPENSIVPMLIER